MQSQSYKEYKMYRVKLMGDKDFFEVTVEDREKIINALTKGHKYIQLGNIFFAASSLASILPVSDMTGEVPYLPNKKIKKLEPCMKNHIKH